MKRSGLVFVAVAALSQLGASECGGGPVLRDPGFDLWCGDQLCSWQVERGEVRRVGTWHEGDSGIELLGPDSAISQLSDVSSRPCILFSMVTNVDERAEAFLDIDLDADGTFERRERIPTSRWTPVSFLISIEPPYNGIHFELGKRGVGTAVLAQIGAELDTGCSGLDPIVSAPPVTVGSQGGRSD